MKSHTLLLLIVCTTVLVGFHSLSAGWTPPTATPPGNNVSVPINVGTSSQEKDGSLGVGGLGVFGSAYVQGASTSDTYDNAVTLEVEGKVGADLYCDETGVHCISIQDMLGTPSATSGLFRQTFSPPRKNNLLLATFGGNGMTTWTQWCIENGFDRAESATMGQTAQPCAGNINRAAAFTGWRYDWNCNYATVKDLVCVRD